MQECFQPTSSPEKEKLRFLCWNSVGKKKIHLGYITLLNDGSQNIIKIDFNDSSRPLQFNDHSNYQYGLLDSNGAVFASLQLIENGRMMVPSTIFYRSIVSFDDNEWSISLPIGEEVMCLAMGTDYYKAVRNTLDCSCY